MRRLAIFSLLVFMACTSKGPQGPEGPAGPKGDTGATGPQGSAGAQGAAGENGAMGVMGATGATGETGAQGPQGLQGPQGAVLVVDGGVLIGPSGASVAVTQLTAGDPACANGGVRVTQLSDGGITNLCNGGAGVQGVAGPQGQQGAQGIQGPAGAQGPQGIQGAIGPQGATGSQGVAGPTGVPGVTASFLANMSAQCMAGGVLLTFADGGTSAVCNGTQGVQGAQGIQGPAGSQGPMGAMGGTGSQGPAGSAGPQGIQGPPGPPGSILYVDGGSPFVPAGRVQFAGFTASSYNGNVGGITGANAICSTNFPGSFLCTFDDFSSAETSASPGAGGAWIDFTRLSTGARSTGSCSNGTTGTWTEPTNGDDAWVLNQYGYTAYANCNTTHPLACCRATKGVFRGFTAATYNGNLGGIIGANAKCSTEFAGSFLCTFDDYSKAETGASPGAAGAWIDFTRLSTGARSTGSCSNGTTGTWIEPTNGDDAWVLNQYGYTAYANCNTVHPLACCQ